MEVLSEREWRGRASAHRERVGAWVEPHLRRGRERVAHPVEDFLFTYYSFRPGRLLQWHPGAGTVLAGASSYGANYRDCEQGAVLDLELVLPQRVAAISWTRELLAATASRPPYLGCFGMHEWAMVYRTPEVEIRHSSFPLRLSPERIEEIVDQRGVRCGHFDAFRFFTPPARPLNVIQPTRERQRELEQPGCLHANMDLYKWAYKLSPMIGSELVADCFALARDIRTVDMRASPYDLSALGYRPIQVETAEGRAEYVAAQRAFTERAAPLRQRLLQECDRLLALA
ncbi:3-methyladenine DNA glycosylase [Streptosporangium sp. NPDC002544]|uniref:3-methyladenine DNA glycosylase n=1 Tax=Streptosporangium sp. NPDC002544 TaxID=3154538 RepID=UPI00331CE5DA